MAIRQRKATLVTLAVPMAPAMAPAFAPAPAQHGHPYERTAGQSSFLSNLPLLGRIGEARLDALTAFLIRIVSAAILYLSQIVLARWMGAFEYGIFVFVWTWILVLGGLSHLGLSTAMMRLLPEHLARGEHDLMRGLLRGGRLVALGGGMLVAALGAFALWQFESKLATYYVWPLMLALICVPIFALSELQDGIGRGRGWIGAALVPPYILRPLMILAGMALVVQMEWPLLAETAAAVALGAALIAVLIQAAVLAASLKAEVAPGLRAYDWRRWFATALPLLVFAASELVFQNTDVLAVSFYLTPADVGMYFAAAKTMSLVMFVHFAVGSAMASRFSTMDATGDKAGLKSLIREAVNLTFWPSLAMAVVIIAFGKQLLGLFAPEFTAGHPIMMIVAIGFLARAAMGPSEFILNTLGQQRMCAMVLASAAALNIVLNLVLTPRFGAIGAATATATSMTIAAVCNAIVARRKLGLSLPIWSNLSSTSGASAAARP